MNRTAETLELRIENAWMRLVERGRKQKPVTLFITKLGTIVGWDNDAPRGCCEIGTYDNGAGLGAFREDVFFAYEEVLKCR